MLLSKRLFYRSIIWMYFTLMVVLSMAVYYASFEIRDLVGTAKAQSEFVFFPILPFLLVSIFWGMIKLIRRLIKNKDSSIVVYSKWTDFALMFNFYYPFACLFIVSCIL